MSLSESETRQQIIDQKLELAGWNVSDPSQVIQELDIVLKGQGDVAAEPNPSPYAGHRFADYALVDKGRPIAVVEAKKASKNAALGREQAVQYAQNIQEIHGGALPFISYTNGHDIYFQEPEFYPPIKVHGFPSRHDLEWLQLRRENRRPLSTELINTNIAGRDYQIAAIRSILEGIEAKRQKFLLVMATGTGKTRTAAALMDVLIRARWAKRILVLVDRIALRDQALEAFKEHIQSEPVWPQKDEKSFARDRRIYVTTYPTMLNMIESGTTPASWISPFFFD
ncbi:MAG: DEAD/DEAH box helicase family protein, partial [Mariprofundus sp.]